MNLESNAGKSNFLILLWSIITIYLCMYVYMFKNHAYTYFFTNLFFIFTCMDVLKITKQTQFKFTTK